MKKYVNWNRFFLIFALCQMVFLLAGCTAAWLGAVSALLPVLETAVTAAVSFVLALEGKTVSADFAAFVKKIGDDVAAEIVQVQNLIAAFKANASTGIVSQIQSIFQAIVANLSQILTGAGITDPSTTSKLGQLVALCVSAAQAILALLPLLVARMKSGASKAELQRDDKLAAASVKNLETGLKAAYVTIVTEPTPNADVNTALESLPQSL